MTFEPGARTAWHTHPLGQTLIVTFGLGRAQRWGGPVEEIRPGDIVSFAPGEKHWHGAAPTTAMTHIAIQEKLDGKPVDWLEHVTAEQYRGTFERGLISDSRRRLMVQYALVVALALVSGWPSSLLAQAGEKGQAMRTAITVTIGDVAFAATLQDNATAMAFKKCCPCRSR